MKNFLLITLFFLINLPLVNAQRFGYIDSQVIIEQLPEYNEAEGKLKKLTDKWLKELDNMKSEIADLERAYSHEEILLTPEMKAEKLENIAELKQALREFQTNHFGYEGLLYSKRMEYMKPLQDKISKACQTVARQKKLNFIFDKASDITLIYSDPKYNYTDFVLDELDEGDPEDSPR
ncbi:MULTISPECIES: OmpH family outer membrane protein [Flammeovirga]|uniref:OmpH family outer membrane protein n=2 Tax=Flammeovirga TaxID=59739 RepID=A0A3S9P445_9BACT|nr:MULTISPECIES: OmpH family outer membrane protein [Flammeovirga]AZQ62963.1 OmpH family outer membrane protein [Flammeovirga pectinis]MBB6459906.1 outer membrane protein [Flammeovirga kamogawensis]QWG07041.1 OmpH family outer membrane protein [Flammeovirga kamogawensis]TRX68862.1 OmpH family outer membrane protein [Flammeovirga kamogawensis]